MTDCGHYAVIQSRLKSRKAPRASPRFTPGLLHPSECLQQLDAGSSERTDRAEASTQSPYLSPRIGKRQKQAGVQAFASERAPARFDERIDRRLDRPRVEGDAVFTESATASIHLILLLWNSQLPHGCEMN
jgi:hypothetical protein